jgi:hypothetical protein
LVGKTQVGVRGQTLNHKSRATGAIKGREIREIQEQFQLLLFAMEISKSLVIKVKCFLVITQDCI